ncbi:MAG: hypothetical protein L0Z53_21165, partial [Acidobacteriales bacterium]|nr:hypothetical protein [Terriglobales bacterium]
MAYAKEPKAVVTFDILVIGLVWLLGACARIYQQAHFYQIEEYMSRRYSRWLLAERERWLPMRPAITWLLGTALGYVFSEAATLTLPGVIAMITAGIAVWPPREGEVKKPFRRTPRATRMLVTALVIPGIFIVAGLLLVGTVQSGTSSGLRYGFVGFVGLLAFLLAPFALIMANQMMTPVEGMLRRRFIQQARDVLADVHP